MSILELKIPPVLQSFACALMMWLLSLWTPGLNIPSSLRMAACIVLLLLSATIGLAAVKSFRLARTTVNPFQPDTATILVRHGIFRFSRNPMYLALLIALVAWGVFLENLYAMAMTAVFVLYMNRFQIRAEEEALRRIFGEEFKSYSREVRRWI
jgi:protein-S-isoprenylcysteine O-methyltransferase Ste14